MTDTPKPPMVVWLDRYAHTVQCMGFYAPKKESLHVNEKGGIKTYGPYVHLDQFLEEVKKRAKEVEKRLKLTIGDWNPSTGIALWELTNELKKTYDANRTNSNDMP